MRWKIFFPFFLVILTLIVGKVWLHPCFCSNSTKTLQYSLGFFASLVLVNKRLLDILPTRYISKKSIRDLFFLEFLSFFYTGLYAYRYLPSILWVLEEGYSFLHLHWRFSEKLFSRSPILDLAHLTVPKWKVLDFLVRSYKEVKLSWNRLQILQRFLW